VFKIHEFYLKFVKFEFSVYLLNIRKDRNYTMRYDRSPASCTVAGSWQCL